MNSRERRLLQLRRRLATGNKRRYYFLVWSAIALTTALGLVYVLSPEATKEHFKSFWEFLSISFGGFAAIFGGGAIFFTKRKETEQYFRLTCYSTICGLFSFTLADVISYPGPAAILDTLLFFAIVWEFFRRKSHRNDGPIRSTVNAIVIAILLLMIGVGGTMVLRASLR